MIKDQALLIAEISINESSTLLSALKLMDKISRKLLIVVTEEGLFKNLISIGDIQRSILNEVPLSTKIEAMSIEEKTVAHQGQSEKDILSLMHSIRAEFMPVINDYSQITSVYFWEDLLDSPLPTSKDKNDIPVVIMAGGKGTRLKPISNVIPKPLTPIGDGTILEEIMSRFQRAGSSKFFLSVNYKKDMIEYYLSSVGKASDIHLFSEDKPLGTAGSLNLLKGKLKETFYVTNCDILIDQDLNEIYSYHKENKNDITLVSSLKHYSIPYGVIESGDNGLLKTMEEKPELTFMINAGIYILEPHLLESIPDDKFFHITELIENVRHKGGRVGVFPISEKSWLDIGEWTEYIKTVRVLSDENNFKGL